MEEILKELVENNPEVESAVVVDEEGIIVYKYEKSPSIDVEEVATQLVNPVNNLCEFVEDTVEGDELKEVLLFSRNYQFFVYKLVNETYLIVVAKNSPLYGRVRFKVRTAIPKLVKQL
ncbi:roadblock/LC7 domain-containing protein [Thermovibrio sp.]